MKNQKMIMTASVLLCFGSVALSADEPDYTKESRFHKIYKDYNEQPTSSEVWGKAIELKKAELYQVQKGDTLSGISSTLFGDPFFWPKIWSLNHQQILNPHEIDPGLNVRFYPGTTDEAPSLQLADASAGVEAPATKVVESVPNIITDKKIALEVPSPKKKRSKLLSNLPESLPNRKLGMPLLGKADLVFEIPSVNYAGANTPLSYYVSDAAIIGSGVVTGIELDLPVAGDFQYIFVQLDGKPEKIYTVQKNKATFKGIKDSGQKAYMVEVQGQIEILGVVNSEKSLYRALVKKSLHSVEVGSLLVPGPLPTYKMDGGEVNSISNLHVIGGQFDSGRKIFGASGLVILDGGASQGLRVGQLLKLYANEKLRTTKTDAIENERRIATLQVVQTSSDFCMAFVRNTSEDILVGDHTGRGSTKSSDIPGKASAAVQENEMEFDESPPSVEGEPEIGTDESELEL